MGRKKERSARGVFGDSGQGFDGTRRSGRTKSGRAKQDRSSQELRGVVFSYSSDSDEIEMGDAHYIGRGRVYETDESFRSSTSRPSRRSRRKRRRKRKLTNGRGLMFFLPTLALFYSVYTMVGGYLMLPKQMNFTIIGFLAGFPAATYFSLGTLYRAVFPLYIFIGLLLMSGWSGHDYHWTLHPGESRVIHTPMGYYLTESVRIQCAEEVGDFEVYRSGQPCPSLSGPRTKLMNKYSMNVSFGDYEYDRYYLNQGSTIDITLSALSGEARLQVFSGFSSFRCWADPKCQLGDGHHVLHTSYVFAPRCYNITHSLEDTRNRTTTWCDKTPSWRKSTANTTHFAFTASESHTLILLYEGVTGNALKGVRDKFFEGKATVRVDLASYDLSSLEPISQTMCSADGSASFVPVTPWAWAECIVLLAVPSEHEKATDKARLSFPKRRNEEFVAVDVSKHQQWVVIFVVSALPLVLSALLGMKKRCTPPPLCECSEEEASRNSSIVYGSAVDMLLT